MYFLKRTYQVFICSFLLISCSKSNKQLEVIDNLKPDSTLLKVEVLVSGMDVPWDLHYGSDHYLWVTEQGGNVWRIDPSNGNKKRVLFIKEVWRQRTSGLLGMVLHPDFSTQPYVFLNYTFKRDSLIFSRLERYRFQHDTLIEPTTILEIGGGTAHNGSRLTVSPDKKIIWATGDAHQFTNAQNDSSLNGKILRINIDGSIPDDNPDKKSYVWAKGFRNIQGLTYSDKGQLYTAEHGDAIEDEINFISKNANYGWPVIEGFHNLEQEQTFAAVNNTTEPLFAWTPVIAPAGLTFYTHPAIPEWNNSLLLGTLKTQSLRILKLNDAGNAILKEDIFFADHYGRIRDVCVGADGAVYFSTSNRDWNPGKGFPKVWDDRILKITPTSKAKHPLLKENTTNTITKLNGEMLYLQYCGSCHKPDGTGVSGIFPALKSSPVVNGSLDKLIKLIVEGRVGKDGAAMPSFSFLKQDEMNAIVNYIRNNWGNQSPLINKKTNTQSRTK